MNMMFEKKQREAERREEENRLFAVSPSTEPERKPVSMGENYIKMEILKNYPFPTTTN